MELPDQVLKSLSLEDLLELSKIKSSGIDFGSGKRDVTLTDPLEYNTYSVEDVPLPEGTEVIVEGSPLNRKEIVVQTDQPTGFERFLLGLRDIVSGNKHDWDRQDRMPLEEFQKQEILKEQRRADIENDNAVPTLEKWVKSLPYRTASDAYEIGKQRAQLDYIFKKYPEYQREAYAAMMPLIAQSRRISEGMPSSIQARMYLSSLAAGANASRQAQMLNAATNAATAGLGRYPGIRVSNT